jgi:hypothetical protein
LGKYKKRRTRVLQPGVTVALLISGTPEEKSMTKLMLGSAFMLSVNWLAIRKTRRVKRAASKNFSIFCVFGHPKFIGTIK